MPDTVPDISIITPCYNAARYLPETLASVRGQDGVTVEHIVIDGGSTDGTVDILRANPHVRWISEPDSGQAQAFNKGLRLARAPIIGWLNADDCYTPGALAAVVDCFHRHPGVFLVNGHLLRVDNDGRVLEFKRARTRPFFLYHFWLGWFGINHPALFYRREVFDRVGLIDEALHYAMDYDFYLRMVQHYRVFDLPRVLTHMRVHAEAKTSAGGVEKFLPDYRHTFAKLWRDRHPLYYRYALLGLRVYAARCHLVRSFLALREADYGLACREFVVALRYWPPLCTLPSFYTYMARVGLRTVLGEHGYCRLGALRRRTVPAPEPNPLDDHVTQ